MAKKITSRELFDGSLFGEQIEEAKALLEVVKDVQKEFKDYGKTIKKEIIALNKDTSEGITKLNNLTKDLDTNTKAFNKTKQEEAKIEQGLIKLMQEEEKFRQQELKSKQEQEKLDQARLKTAEAESKLAAQNERAAIASRKEAERLQKIKDRELLQLKKSQSLYAKQSKRLRDLKGEYKDLVLAGKQNEKATQDLLKSVKQLDGELKELDAQVGENFRNVGNYTEALEKTKKAVDDLNNTAKATGLLLLIDKVAGFALDLFGNSREGTIEFQKQVAKVTASVEVFVKSTIQAGLGLKDVLEGSFALINTKFDKFLDEVQTGFLNLQKFGQEALAFFGSEGAEKGLKETTAALDELEKKTYDTAAANEQLAKGIEKVTTAYDNDTVAADKNLEIKIKFLELAQQTEIANLALQRSVVGLTTDQEKFALIAEDDTRGFNERRQATEKWLAANKEVAEVQEQIAKNENEVAKIRLIGNLVSEQAITSAEADALLKDKEIRQGKDLIELLKQKDIASKVSSENDQAFTESLIAYQEAIKDAAITALETQEKNAKLLSDDLEKELDILIDGADVRKSINEKIISDETVSLANRRKILGDTQVLLNTSFERQKALIVEFGTERIKLNKELTASEKAAALERLKNADINDLANTTDATQLQEKIRLLGLSEIFEGRLFEVIKERAIATKDLTDAQKELNQSERETQEIQNDIIQQEETLAKIRKASTNKDLEAAEKELETERQKNRLKAIDEELKAVEDGSKAALELEQERNDIEIEMAKKRLDEETKIQEQRKEIYASTIAALQNISDDYYDKERQKIEDNLAASKKAEDQLIKAAEKGVSLSEESIAFERKQQAELAREKEQLAQKQARTDLFLASLDSLQANDGNVGKTITDMVALREFVKAFPLFYAGTEDTGAGGAVDEKGGFAAILHPHERVMTREQNDRIKASVGNVSNEELTSMAEKYANNTVAGVEDVQIIKQHDYNKKFDSLQKEIRDLPKRMPVNKLDFDPIRKVMIEQVKKEGSKTKYIHKTNKLF